MSIKSSRRIRRVALAAAVAVAALSGAQAHAAVTTYNISKSTTRLSMTLVTLIGTRYLMGHLISIPIPKPYPT